MKTNAIKASQTAALDAAGIAMGRLPLTAVEWDGLVWKAFEAGRQYETAAIHEENARLIEALESIADMDKRVAADCESPKHMQAFLYHEMRKIAKAALSGKPSGEGAVQPEPCKKCGAESLSLMLSAPPGMKYPFSQVGCALCGAKGPIGKNDSTAIARWNALSSEPSGKVLVDREQLRETAKRIAEAIFPPEQEGNRDRQSQSFAGNLKPPPSRERSKHGLES